MIRPLAVLSLIFTLVVAMQNHREFWVVYKSACPPEMRRLAQSREEVSNPCSGLPAERECASDISVCRSAEGECRYDQPESPCDPICSPTADVCTSTTAAPICLELPCRPLPIEIPCCLLVHPFWGELPAKILPPADNCSISAMAPRLAEIADRNNIVADKYLIPPWGVHPMIATTVLRI